MRGELVAAPGPPPDLAGKASSPPLSPAFAEENSKREACTPPICLHQTLRPPPSSQDPWPHTPATRPCTPSARQALKHPRDKSSGA